MRFVIYIVLAGLLNFVCTGTQLRLSSGLTFRLRRREQLTALHRLALGAKKITKTVSKAGDLFRMNKSGRHLKGVFCGALESFQAFDPLPYISGEISSSSALLDPPLVPPPKV